MILYVVVILFGQAISAAQVNSPAECAAVGLIIKESAKHIPNKRWKVTESDLQVKCLKRAPMIYPFVGERA